MCQSKSKGGKRCAAHTRPKFEAATLGTPEWDKAAAEYGRTREGRDVLTSRTLAAVAEQDWSGAAAHQQAIAAAERADEAQQEYDRLHEQMLDKVYNCEDAAELDRLADSKDRDVRAAVATNRHTSEATLLRMAKTGTARVRQLIAERPSAPDSVFETLAHDPEPAVQHGLLARMPRPVSVLRTLASSDNKYLRSRVVEVAGAAGLPDLVDAMASDSDYEVRGRVAQHSKSPEVLQRLTFDENIPWVAGAAMLNSHLRTADLEAALHARGADIDNRDTTNRMFAGDVNRLRQRIMREGVQFVI